MSDSRQHGYIANRIRVALARSTKLSIDNTSRKQQYPTRVTSRISSQKMISIDCCFAAITLTACMVYFFMGSNVLSERNEAFGVVCAPRLDITNSNEWQIPA